MNKYVFQKLVCVFVLVYLVLQMQSSSQIILLYEFFKISALQKICSDHRDFIKCSKELTHRFLTKGYPMTIINKPWQKVVNIHRVNPLRY